MRAPADLQTGAGPDAAVAAVAAASSMAGCRHVVAGLALRMVALGTAAVPAWLRRELQPEPLAAHTRGMFVAPAACRVAAARLEAPTRV